MMTKAIDMQTSYVPRGTGYYVHYGDDYVTDNKNAHLRMTGCTDAVVSDRSFCERKDDA